jgi:hypothetical protein
MITDRVSNINIPLITIKPRTVSVIIAITARVAQSESEPVSHINTCAGCILYHKNAINAHAIMRQNAERI